MACSLRAPLVGIALGLLLFIASMALTAPAQGQDGSGAYAEPSRFHGSVTVNGEPAPDGTLIEAVIRGIVCGAGTAEDGRYALSVRAGGGEGDDYQKGCGGGGDEVSFRFGDLVAEQKGTFAGLTIQKLDLNFGVSPPPQAGAEPAYFRGSVTIDGEVPPDGTPIEALIEDTICGTTTTSEGRYSITVNTNLGVGFDFQEGCGREGDDVLFRTGELIAAERGRFVQGGVQNLDLTFGGLSGDGIPPALPDTGAGGASGPGNAIPPWLLWVLTVAGTVAVGAAARGRRAGS